MANPQAWIAYLQGNEFLPILRFGRDGSLLGATPNAIALLEAPPWPGQDLAHTLLLGPEGEALLATEGVWRGAGSLLRGERLPVSVRLEAYGAGSEVIVLLSVEGEALMRLQEDISEVNNELASLTRERAKQSQRLSRALRDVEGKRAQIEAQHQQLEDNTFELEQMVFELDEANRKLTEMDAIKTRFYANMNHELRTPLNSIIGFAEDALDGLAGPLTPDLEQYFKTIEASGKRQLSLINDLLDFAKLQAGKIMLEPVAIAPKAIAGELASTLRPLLGRKRQTLVLDLPDDLPAIHADHDKLFQILLNLLSNAHKFTPDGGTITLSARVEEAAMRLSVADTGVGIAPENLPHLFDEFYQVKRRRGDHQPGTGLGLAITRQLVALHGGRIWAESKLGEGSAFSLTLPLPPPSQTPMC